VNNSWVTLLVGMVALVSGVMFWRYRRRMTIKFKLLVMGAAIGVGSVAVVAYVGITKSTEALFAMSEKSLVGTREQRKERIENYFEFIHEQMANFARDRMIGEAVSKLAAAFHALPDQLHLTADDHSDTVRDVTRYYENEFHSRLSQADQPWRGVNTYVPQLPEARIAQAMYIANNPHPVGSKIDLDRAEADCDYNRLHAIYHPIIRDFLKSFGYYDIFLFDLKGNIVYTVFKETDYSTNFLNGPYRDTNFGEVFRKALASNTPGSVYIADFLPYEPSYGAPASFIASPIFLDGKKVGVAAFQMPVDKINQIMTSAAGLGETGQSYLIGPDGRMRCNSRFSEESTIFVQQVDSQAAKAAISGQTGDIRQTDYLGNSVQASYAPLNIEGLDWAILAEVHESEIRADVDRLRTFMVIVGAAATIVVAVLFWLVAATITRPVNVLIERVKDIAQGEGDLTQRVEVNSDDEIGQLGTWFNAFVQKIHDVIADVAGVTREVASAATEIAASAEEMAQGMDEQNQQVTQISSAVEQMSASVVEVARKSADAAGRSEDSGKVAAKAATSSTRPLRA